jgi:hypothetical protein
MRMNQVEAKASQKKLADEAGVTPFRFTRAFRNIARFLFRCGSD